MKLSEITVLGTMVVLCLDHKPGLLTLLARFNKYKYKTLVEVQFQIMDF